MYLQRWLTRQRLRREIKRWLRYEGERAAAQAMFHLNQHARGSYHGRSEIYTLKSKLIEHWYYSDRLQSVRLQKQVMVCWGCNGTGVDDEWHDSERCDRCGGTGVYREHFLYVFVFRIEGRAYQWHQPKSVCHYPVFVSEEESPTAYRAGNDYHLLSNGVLSLYLLAVAEYLVNQGVMTEYVPFGEPTALHEALGRDLRRWWDNTRVGRQIAAFMAKKRRWIRFMGTGELQDRNDFPF